MEFALIALSIISVSFFIALVYSTQKIKSVSEGFANLFMAYNTLREAADSSSEFNNTEEEIHKENFIKFLSDSRDWAFTYIEEVQNGLKQFIEEVEPQLKHYNQYGIVVEGVIPPHDSALKKISKEFENLKKFLPGEFSDRR